MRSISSKTLACLGSAGAVLGVTDANAAVVHWAANLVIPATIDGLYINVETQQTSSQVSSVPGWDLNPYSPITLGWYIGGSGAGMMRYPGVVIGGAGSLASGTQVDSTRSFSSNSDNASVTVGGAAGDWSLNAVNYFGFRFIAADGLTHYGWGSMQVGASITTRTLVDLAWENVAGTPILVGALPAPVPETSTVAAGALVGLAVGARFVVQRRRQATRQQAQPINA